MMSSKPEEIIQLEHLIAEGKYERALDDIDVFETTSRLDSAALLSMKIYKAKLLNKIGEFQQGLTLIESILADYRYLESAAPIYDALLIKTSLLLSLNNIEEGSTILNKASDILKELKNLKSADLVIRKANYHFVKGEIFEKQEDLKSALNEYLQSLSLNRELDEKPGIAEASSAAARIYFKTGDVIRSQLIYQQSLDIYSEIGNDLETSYILNKVGDSYAWKGDYGLALENNLQSLALAEEIENEKAIATFLMSISEIFYRLGELDRSLEYLERALSIREEKNDKRSIAETLNSLSKIFYRKGEIEKAFDYVKQSLEIFEKLNDKIGLASVNETLGKLNYQQGDSKSAIDNFKKSLELRENQKNKRDITETLFWLINVNVANNTLGQVQTYLQRIQKIIEKEKNDISNLVYRLASAILLKTSSKNDILTKAKTILESIIENVLLDHEYKNIALYTLCELLIKSIELFRDKDAIQYLETMIEKYFETAKQIESHSMIAESFWLKVQLAMIRHQYQEARNYLNQTQQITEDKGFRRIASDIPRMRKILDSYFELDAKPTQETQLSFERSIATPVNEDVIRMVDKRTVDMPKLQEEEPVLLIIVYEGGVTIFSKKFSPKEMIDEMFVGGFLTAIDSFMHQTFATGGSIERIKHQEYTLLLKAEKPLLFCYVYKGQSFTAIQKLDKIISELKKSVTIWHSLTNNLGEQLNDLENDFIEELATKVFMK
ncbi:MAG TPA: tetratricopeptide repeat protein [candidate division Zixibacteria bacterium]|nr:tetratricopeptide repeat protein [candidate division Zixibacteria bacterium]